MQKLGSLLIPVVMLASAISLISCGAKQEGSPRDGTLREGTISPSSLAAVKPNAIRLEHAAASPDALVREALNAFAAGDTAALLGMLVTEREFKNDLYPEYGKHYPAAADLSEQARQFVWENHSLGAIKALRKGMKELGGRRMDLVSVAFADGAKRFGSYTIHEGTDVRVRLENGEEADLLSFGAIVEMDGVYKLLSYRDRN